MLFTIFTPTYNRAYTLQKLYNSLLLQSFNDFEWLIIDDGSTDHTEELIDSFIIENKIKIRYYKKNNQGKHIAINRSLELACGDFIITIDSDDYFTENALEKCKLITEKITGNEDFAGFTYIHFSENIDFNPSNYGNISWTEPNSYQWEFHGEMAYVFKTEVARKYRFPVFKNEKFCQESAILLPILRDYKVLFTNHVLAHGDYLEDGLSQNFYKRMLNSPRYSMYTQNERIKSAKTCKHKKQYAKIYWDIALKSPHISWFEKIKGIPLGFTIKIFCEKLKNIAFKSSIKTL